MSKSEIDGAAKDSSKNLNINNLDEIRRRAAKDGYSEDEIAKFITMGKQLAGKTVLSALIYILKEGPIKGFDASSADKLIKKVEKKFPYNYCGFVQCVFKETTFLLNICLSLVDKNYRAEIDIPNGSYARDLFTKYDFLKKTAIAYWRQFCEENPKLLGKICDYRPDVDFSELTIDKDNPTTLYFDSECAKRIGIFAYYVDANGQPFYKRTKKE